MLAGVDLVGGKGNSGAEKGLGWRREKEWRRGNQPTSLVKRKLEGRQPCGCMRAVGWWGLESQCAILTTIGMALRGKIPWLVYYVPYFYNILVY
jgi:hypothetical protein